MQSTDSQPAESRKSVSREEVKLLAISVGVREAARQLGLKEDRVRQWSSREGWFKTPDAPTTVQNRNRVTNVTIAPSDALQTQLRDDSEQTKLSLSRSVRRGAKALEDDLPAIAVFTAADKVKHLVGAASQLHGWEQSAQSNNLDINVLAGGRAVIQVVQNQGDTAEPQP